MDVGHSSVGLRFSFNLRYYLFGVRWTVGSILILNCLVSLQASTTEIVDSTKQQEDIATASRDADLTTNGLQSENTEPTYQDDQQTEILLQTQETDPTEKITQITEADIDRIEKYVTTFTNNTEYTSNILQEEYQNIDTTTYSASTVGLQNVITDNNINENNTTDLKLKHKIIPDVKKIMSQLDTKLNDMTNILNTNNTSIDINKFVDSFKILNVWNKNAPTETLSTNSDENQNTNEKYVFLQVNQYSKKTGDIMNTILSTKDLTHKSKHNNNLTKRTANIDGTQKDVQYKNMKNNDRVERSDNNFNNNSATSTEELDNKSFPRSLFTMINTGQIKNVSMNVTFKENNYIFNNATIEPGIHFISKVINESVAEYVTALLTTSFKNKTDLTIFGKKGKKKLIKSIAKSIAESLVVIINTGTIDGLILNLPGPNKCSEISNDDKTSTKNFYQQDTTGVSEEYSSGMTSETPNVEITSMTVNSEVISPISEPEATLNLHFKSTKKEFNSDEYLEQITNTYHVTDVLAEGTIYSVSTNQNLSDDVFTDNLNTTTGTASNTDTTQRNKKISKREISKNNLQTPLIGTVMSHSNRDSVRSIVDYLKHILNQGNTPNSTRKLNFIPHDSIAPSDLNSKF